MRHPGRAGWPSFALLLFREGRKQFWQGQRGWQDGDDVRRDDGRKRALTSRRLKLNHLPVLENDFGYGRDIISPTRRSRQKPPPNKDLATPHRLC